VRVGNGRLKVDDADKGYTVAQARHVESASEAGCLLKSTKDSEDIESLCS